ncbi:hypothetical protein KKC94_05515 [Patescibacteria group bacterium]|nr:hypothetical protein [Patescibacteria group bacterium]
MIFLQALYGLILEEISGSELSELSRKAMSHILSAERKHRSIRNYKI